MKKAFKIYLAFLLFSVAVPIGCSDPERHYYEWNDFNLSKLELYTENGWLNYRTTDEVNFAPLTFGTRINFSYLMLANLIDILPDFTTSAYAFSYDEDIYYLTDFIASIKITTINDFDESHPAGSDVTNYFKTLYAGDFVDVNAMLNVTNGLNITRYQESQLSKQFDMYLRENPTFETAQQFEIEVKFLSGKSLVKLTDVIFIE